MRPLARKDEILIQEVDGETLVYDLKSNRAICLNDTSAIIWQNCDGKKDAKQIAKAVEMKTGSQVNEEFVWFAVNQLNKENLIKPVADYSDKFEGLSRREVIKKIGMGSMVALPIVASLVAPTASYAQSCVPLTNCMGTTMRGAGCDCTTNAQCCDNTCVNVMGDGMGPIC